MLILLIDKAVSDFFERFLVNAVTPVILLLLIIFAVNYKKQKLKLAKPYCYILIFYVISDLFLRLYYTFINNMENQTRYFFIQAIFYLIPAAAAFEFITARVKVNRENILAGIYLLLFLITCVISFRPKWDKAEYESFSKIVAQDSRSPKYIFKLVSNDGKMAMERDLRSSYYAGIFTNDSIHNFEELKKSGVCYIIVEDYPCIDPSLKLITESKSNKNKKIFLYEKVVIEK